MITRAFQGDQGNTIIKQLLQLQQLRTGKYEEGQQKANGGTRKKFAVDTQRRRVLAAKNSANDDKEAARALDQRLMKKRKGLGSAWDSTARKVSKVDVKSWNDYNWAERQKLVKVWHKDVKIWCKVSANPFNIAEQDGKVLEDKNCVIEGVTYRKWRTGDGDNKETFYYNPSTKKAFNLIKDQNGKKKMTPRKSRHQAASSGMPRNSSLWNVTVLVNQHSGKEEVGTVVKVHKPITPGGAPVYDVRFDGEASGKETAQVSHIKSPPVFRLHVPAHEIEVFDEDDEEASSNNRNFIKPFTKVKTTRMSKEKPGLLFSTRVCVSLKEEKEKPSVKGRDDDEDDEDIGGVDDADYEYDDDTASGATGGGTKKGRRRRIKLPRNPTDQLARLGEALNFARTMFAPVVSRECEGEVTRVSSDGDGGETTYDIKFVGNDSRTTYERGVPAVYICPETDKLEKVLKLVDSGENFDNDAGKSATLGSFSEGYGKFEIGSKVKMSRASPSTYGTPEQLKKEERCMALLDMVKRATVGSFSDGHRKFDSANILRRSKGADARDADCFEAAFEVSNEGRNIQKHVYTHVPLRDMKGKVRTFRIKEVYDEGEGQPPSFSVESVAQTDEEKPKVRYLDSIVASNEGALQIFVEKDYPKRRLGKVTKLHDSEGTSTYDVSLDSSKEVETRVPKSDLTPVDGDDGGAARRGQEEIKMGSRVIIKTKPKQPRYNILYGQQPAEHLKKGTHVYSLEGNMTEWEGDVLKVHESGAGTTYDIMFTKPREREEKNVPASAVKLAVSAVEALGAGSSLEGNVAATIRKHSRVTMTTWSPGLTVEARHPRYENVSKLEKITDDEIAKTVTDDFGEAYIAHFAPRASEEPKDKEQGDANDGTMKKKPAEVVDDENTRIFVPLREMAQKVLSADGTQVTWKQRPSPGDFPAARAGKAHRAECKLTKNGPYVQRYGPKFGDRVSRIAAELLSQVHFFKRRLRQSQSWTLKMMEGWKLTMPDGGKTKAKGAKWAVTFEPSNVKTVRVVETQPTLIKTSAVKKLRIDMKMYKEPRIRKVRNFTYDVTFTPKEAFDFREDAAEQQSAALSKQRSETRQRERARLSWLSHEDPLPRGV